MSSIRNFEKYSTLFCFHFRANKPEVDHCVSEFILHGTVSIKDFSVFEKWIFLIGNLEFQLTSAPLKLCKWPKP